MAETKRKRISKKNKSAWRKTDITDVEEYLEEKRQDERVGSYTEKKDEDLFTIDVTPKVPKKKSLTPKQRRKVNAQKPMRSWEGIKNTSKVQDPIAKRNTVKQKKNGRNIEEEIINPTKPRHFKANADREKYYKELEAREVKPRDDPNKSAKDIWAVEDFREKVPGLKGEKDWVSKPLARYIANNVGEYVYKVHDGLRHRTTKAKKFEPPHPGMSYNPSFEDHKQLLDTVVEREEKIIKQEKHLKRVTTDMFSKVTPEERDRRKLEELSVGIEDEEEKGEEEAEGKPTENSKTVEKKGQKRKAEEEEKENVEEDEDAGVYKSINAPVENKKKTRQKRNRELRQKELERKQLEKKALKKQIAEINRIKSIKKDIELEEEELNELKKRRKKAAEQRKYEPKRLSRVKFQEPDADINMPEDISGNLRNVKPESSLLVDRFKNFQKRNILPASVKAPRQKKPKVKRFPRSSHKEPGISYDMLRAQKKAALANKT